MATSFARADVPDPNKILDFVETSTSSVAAVFEVNIDCNIQANIVILSPIVNSKLLISF